jgi:DNA ligase (NAD+)
MQYLKSLGFKLNPNNTLCRSINEAKAFYAKWVKNQEALPYEADGVVVKINSIPYQVELGYVGREPRWAIAYKFPAVQGVTRLLEIRINVGRTGSLNPYAILEPVQVGGVTISRAALHNEEDIHRKDIRIGDWVVIQRAGEVIPEIVEPIVSRRTGKEKIFHMPKRCPVCNAEVIKPEGEAMHRCTNAACPAQALERIKHFVSRGAMDIEGVGERMSQALFEAGLIKNVGDLYGLKEKRGQLLNMEKLADKSVTNILNSIEKSKNRPLPRVIFALGIPNIGDQTAELLAEHFTNLDELAEASREKLQEIPSIGPKITDSILAFFRQKQNQKIIDKLRKAGVKLEAEKAETRELPLAGLEFVITGTLEAFPRPEAEAKIKALGGKASSDVTRKTNYLVVGEDPGSKLARAQALGTKTLTESEFLELLKKSENKLK